MTDLRKPEANFELYPLGEQAVVIRWEGGISEQTQRLVSRCADCLERHRFPELVELVAAYRTVTVYYDPVALFRSFYRSYETEDMTDGRELDSPYELVCRWIHSSLLELQLPDAGRDSQGEKADRLAAVTTVPVCFGGAYGPDLEAVADHAGLTPGEVISLYCSATYFVHMIGFVPGFPYLGGLPEPLAMPRRAVPRLEIPSGSVGIAGAQTGIYPLATPGGWQLIGRTPLTLFDAGRPQPSLLKAGDFVRFIPVTEAEFAVRCTGSV